MRIAFYAPMKPPDHPVASGDRKIARLFLQAVEQTDHQVQTASTMRTWEGQGDKVAQAKIKQRCDDEVKRLLNEYQTVNQKPDLWFTYHAYHKAPDWIGAAVCAALDIPYVIAEASIANKQKNGRWHAGHMQTTKCVNQAQAVVSLNHTDLPGVQPHLNAAAKSVYLPPFLDTQTISKRSEGLRKKIAEKLSLDTNACWLFTAAMMRDGDKTQSYKTLAECVAKLKSSNWQLISAGDGEQKALVESFFSSNADRVMFTGELAQADVYDFFSVCDVFVWPSINEAFGMALLEAQAHGLPAVVGDFGGVDTIVEDGETGFVVTGMSKPQESTLAKAFVNKLDLLITDSEMRKQLGVAAREKVRASHSLASAAKRLNDLFNDLTKSACS